MSLSPVIFRIGSISIYWYSLAYIFGIAFAHWYSYKLDNQKIFTKNFHDSLLTVTIIGVILGGRLGYVLIYDLGYYVNNPIEILKTWKGGMSFHGGAIGVFLAVAILCKKYNIPVFYTLDLISCGVPVGLFLGRIGNLINGELFGRITTIPWGIVFSESDNLPRHPSQLYEAFFEGLLLFIVMNLLFFLTRIRLYRGTLTSIAVIWYGIVRFMVEFLREPDYQLGYLWLGLTMGQLLSAPMILLGTILFLSALNLKFTSTEKR
ncbi:prolipoprotein diacylglyceryl transferase [Wolbachia endosymbiont of Dirofilaria (Dirofilaria) immitis]|uniref:prolipoprotein diacylglyceryl transferase n=1 Tax=Wolbachia endosymbiont of Dirofilaria (Dirofilaria) immitis TaxID=1812115 RepID=UPI0015897894|nr:prolipoprotein diacylglyceryl transferase [Wolbachia endosymbiont of Dirofilaria (Dirofilaria) immitis]QKX02487.1 prolipoprotein diacylglyceryl transferase [Wolbachia endosymbiont of Dirofilaria (Dirofilaria) immitis]